MKFGNLYRKLSFEPVLATRGGPGPADAIDPVDRESSAVQAVTIFYPVTDLLTSICAMAADRGKQLTASRGVDYLGRSFILSR